MQVAAAGPLKVTVAGGASGVRGRDVFESLEAQMDERQAAEHLQYHTEETREAERASHPVIRLLLLLRLEALANDDAIAQTVTRIRAPATRVVLSSLLRACSTKNPSGEPINAEARRQLVFFCNSLHNRRLGRPPPVVEMKSLTAFTPHFSEDVTYSMEALQIAGDDNASLLTILKSLTPDEWTNLCERVDDLESHTLQERAGGVVAVGHGTRAGGPTSKEKNKKASGMGVPPSGRKSEDISEEELAYADGRRPVDLVVADWASDRSQLLGRTVRGVMRNVHALKILALMEGVARDHVEAVVGSKFEYLVTCQIYDKLKNSANPVDQHKAQSIDALRARFASNLRVAYVEHDEAKSSFSSVLLASGGESEPNVMLYKVQLPGNPIIGEGKPENQNHAIIFARGECLQTLDMNQDMYLSEAFKTRNLLELFTGNTRIVGFREQVFSESSGLVAAFAASNEFVFGTMMQRVMSRLCVRLHYGHPDVWDKVWASSSGGVSKASRTLHVSEDIFGGVNVLLRGGQVHYEEFILVGKARDITFSVGAAHSNRAGCTRRPTVRGANLCPPCDRTMRVPACQLSFECDPVGR